MKPFTMAFIRDLDSKYIKEEITYSRMVELMNEKANIYYESKYKDGWNNALDFISVILMADERIDKSTKDFILNYLK